MSDKEHHDLKHEWNPFYNLDKATLNPQLMLNLKRRIPEIKSLAMLKMEKNFIAQEKGYPRQPYLAHPFHLIFKHLQKEVEELQQAYEKKDLTNMKEEIADISNLCDYLFELVEQGRSDSS